MMFARTSLVFAAVLTFGAGCAGQLDLAPEAYQSGAQTSNGGGSDAGSNTPSNIPVGMGPSAPGPAAATDTGPAGAADAGWNMPNPGSPVVGGDAGAATADAVAVTPPPSACPPGVDALALLANRCGNCHGSRSPAKDLDLVTAGAGARLVGIKSSCASRPLLDPPSEGALGGAATGHFIDKLDGPVAGCGAQMPYGTPALTPGERDCLVEWSTQAVARAKK